MLKLLLPALILASVCSGNNCTDKEAEIRKEVSQNFGITDISIHDAEAISEFEVLPPKKSSVPLETEGDSLFSVNGFFGSGPTQCVAPFGLRMTCQNNKGYTVMREKSVDLMVLTYSWWVPEHSSSSAWVIGRDYTNDYESWRGGGIGKSASFEVPWYGKTALK